MHSFSLDTVPSQPPSKFTHTCFLFLHFIAYLTLFILVFVVFLAWFFQFIKIQVHFPSSSSSSFSSFHSNLNSSFFFAKNSFLTSPSIPKLLSRFSDFESYCKAPLIENYPTYFNSKLKKLILITRHGDRTPHHVLTTDQNLTWQCRPSFLQFKPTTSFPSSSFLTSSSFVTQKSMHLNSSEPMFSNLWLGQCGISELTIQGEEMMQELGQKLRTIYIDQLGFLPKELDTKRIYVRSTDTSRTLASAAALLEGLYPTSFNTSSSTSFFPFSNDSQPWITKVKLHTLPFELDPWHTRGARHFCSNLTLFYSNAPFHPLYQQFQVHFHSLLNQLHSIPLHPISATHTTDPEGLPSIIEHVLCRYCHQYPVFPFSSSNTHSNPKTKSHMPLVTGKQNKKKKDPRPPLENDVHQLWSMRSFALWFHYQFFPTLPLQQLWFHHLITSFLYWLQPSVPFASSSSSSSSSTFPKDSHKDPTTMIFLTHDGTLYAFLVLFNLTHQFGWPGYRSHFILEWYENDHVRLFYNGHLVQVPSCPSLRSSSSSLSSELMCPLHQVVQHLSMYMTNSWDTQCGMRK